MIVSNVRLVLNDVPTIISTDLGRVAEERSTSELDTSMMPQQVNSLKVVVEGTSVSDGSGDADGIPGDLAYATMAEKGAVYVDLKDVVAEV